MKLKNVEKQLCKLFKNQWGGLPEIEYDDDDPKGVSADIYLNYTLANVSKDFYFSVSIYENFAQVFIILGKIAWSKEVAYAINNFNDISNIFRAYHTDGELRLCYTDGFLKDEKNLENFFNRAVTAFEIYIDRLEGIWEQIQENDGE